MPGKARASTDTFWSNKRVESGITLKDLSDYLKMDSTRVCRILSGQILPSTMTAIAICDLFDVDYAVGAKEFVKANQAWDKAQHKREKQNQVMRDVLQEKRAESHAFMEALYGAISYDDFKAIMVGKVAKPDIPEYLYGRVDYDTYTRLMSYIRK